MSQIPGIAQFAYTMDLPTDAIALASISSTLTTPADLVDILNTPYLPASLGIWLATTATTAPADFVCPDYNQPVMIQGSVEYNIDNQFFLLTPITDAYSNPMWYMHNISSLASGNISVLDLSGNLVTTQYIVIGNILYHSLADQPYLVEYTDQYGYIHNDLMQTNLVVASNSYQTGANNYMLIGRTLQVGTTGPYYIEFTQPDGYMALAPWTSQPNSPWYMRIRYPLNPFPTEWATQIFNPQSPYILASYVPGTVYANNIIQFERPNILINNSQLPDILVFNSDFSIKYALDGTPPGSPKTKGTEYAWQRGCIVSIDSHSARVQLSLDIDSTDIVYGFYSYTEMDVLFTEIDINPFTNSVVKNRYVEFYAKTSNPDPLTNIFYQVVDPVNGPVIGATNDANTTTGINEVFATISVGAAVSPAAFTVTDIRQRGGGLTTNYQTDVSSYSCWDIGFLDGKPYPVSGGIIVYAPASLLTTMSSATVQAKIQQVLPAGVYPLVRFYESDGTEIV